MRKYLNSLINNPNSRQEKGLMNKIRELLFGAIFVLLLMIGTVVAYFFNKESHIGSILSMLVILLILLTVIALRYAYYYYTGNFKVVIGECEEVSYSPLKKAMKRDCEIFVKDFQGVLYRFNYPYKKMLFKKGNVIRVIVPDINEEYKKNGYIQLYNIIYVGGENV